MRSTLPSPPPTHGALDRTGVIASVGCAIHCMVAPLILLLAPTLGGWWVHPATHLLIAALVLPVAAMALLRGLRSHGRRWVYHLGLVGMGLVIVGVLLPFLGSHGAGAAVGGAHDACCPTLQRDAATGTLALRIPPASVVTLLGGMALIAAHLGNLRACRLACTCDD